MNPDEILEDDEECFVIPLPADSEDDDEDTMIVCALVPLDEAMAILSQS